MPRQNLNVDVKIVGKKGKVRKRGCSSSSSSSLVQNYRLKRTFLLGKKVGSTTPVPLWKMMSSESQIMENDKGFKNLAAKNGDKAKELTVSARKLAAMLWEINGLPSPRVKREVLEDSISEVGMVRKERILESSVELGLSYPFCSPVSEEMDPPKSGSHGRRASAGSQKLLQTDFNLSLHNCLVQVDQMQRHVGERNCLKDVHNGLMTSKELLKLLSRVCCLEQLNCTSAPLVSALKVELDRVFTHVDKLFQRQHRKSEIDILFEEEKVVLRSKEQDKIHSAVTSIARELEIEKKLRRQTEKLNKKLGRELAETKASLSRATKELKSEKRAREIVEQKCDELARGTRQDKAEVEELKRQAAKVREEIEKEREMFQLADIIREERVKMKLSEAKYLLEEKNALVDKLRNELEAYLKSKKGEEKYEKVKELEKYLRETYPGSSQIEEIEQEVLKEEDEEEEDDSGDSDLHSIELNVDDISKSFRWRNDAIRNRSRRSSVDKSKESKPISEKTEKPKMSQPENLDVFDSRALFEFTSSSTKDVEEEMERYKMIKDLRDNIVSGSRLASSQELASSSQEKIGIKRL